MELEKKTELRQHVRAEFYRPCCVVRDRIEALRPDGPHERRHGLARRIVERRLRQSKMGEIVGLAVEGPLLRGRVVCP